MSKLEKFDYDQKENNGLCEDYNKAIDSRVAGIRCKEDGEFIWRVTREYGSQHIEIRDDFFEEIVVNKKHIKQFIEALKFISE